MKKQIFILAFLVLATFASVTKSFGQVNPTAAVSQIPSCITSPTTPSVGETYDYTVDIGPAGGFLGGGTYDWYVTQNTNLLTAANIITAANTDFAATGIYHASAAGTAKTIKLTWTSAAVTNAQPYYLVVNYTETNGTCNPSNIRVYRIKPENTFWLKIEPANSDGTTAAAPIAFCPSIITGANITEGSPATVEYTYAATNMYVLINAGGYKGNWAANLQLSNLADDQTIASISYTGTASGSGTFTAPGSITYGAGVSGVWSTTLKSIAGATTEPILVTIVINNNHHQGLVDQKINIAIDGSYGLGVFKDRTGGACSDETAYADYVDMTIKARPTVSPITPATFVSAPTAK